VKSLDFPAAEGELGPQPADPGDPDAFFHREWVQAVFALAVERLRARCRQTGRKADFTLFARYDLEGDDPPGRPTYAEVGRDLGMNASQVTNRLAAARREFRAIVLDALRELTGSEDEFRAEARQLLGVEP
jgi:hypothetical protein